MATITIDPATRLEGHLGVKLEVEGGKVVSAKSSGTLFRGFENLLGGKDPRDAVQITQRVCGVCPISHAMAATMALEAATNLRITDNARLIRNLILGADFLHSHVLQFYHLSLPSYVSFEGTALGMPTWVPAYNVDLRFNAAESGALIANYAQALSVRREAHEMGAVFAGKLPQTSAYEFGGVAVVPSAEMVGRFRAYLDRIITFIDGVYLPDVRLLDERYSDYRQIGRGYGNLLSFGAFDLTASGSKLFARGRVENAGATAGKGGGRKGQTVDPSAIAEQVTYSWYGDASGGLNPSQGVTQPNPDKAGAYSWLKAPRYSGLPYEVGPLARMWISGAHTRGVSVMDRHLARAIEAQKLAYAMRDWLGQISPGAEVFVDKPVPQVGSGAGLTEAPRGALGHWVKVNNKAIANYQILTPTCWNFSPRDNAGVPGPLEKALEGVPVADQSQPIEVLRVIQSLDPCLACAVH